MLSKETNSLFRNLMLIGTVHRDPSGMARLSRFYGDMEPDCILLEFSRHGLVHRQMCQTRLQKDLMDNLRQVSRRTGIDIKTLLKHPQISAIRRQLSLPFEYRASRRYALKKGIPFFLIDHSRFSRRWTRLWPDLVRRQNLHLLAISASEPRSLCSLSYRQAARWIDGGGVRHSRCRAMIAASTELEWIRREQHLARKTVAILSRLQPLRPVFVGGWRHLVRGDSQPSLGDYLGVQAHQCILLDRIFL